MASGSILSLLGAARTRIVSGSNSTLSGGVLSKTDDDVTSQALEIAYIEKAENPTFKPIDWIELAIAKRIDAGEQYPIGDVYIFRGAEWIAQMDISTLPNPMPRDFVLYLAMAAVLEGKSTSVHTTVLQLINTYQFV